MIVCFLAVVIISLYTTNSDKAEPNGILCGANNDTDTVGVCMLPADCDGAGWSQGPSHICLKEKDSVCCYQNTTTTAENS
ncbi:hypothetical protein SNE40_021516 [Patella caerulea]|uniref:Uncharacterized protein n=1 Tax=Patella caerulea TaxID=87958 RepID=A0AAN8GBC1_PATCE